VLLSLAAIAARLIQFLGAMVLFGAPLFYLYGLPTEGRGSAASYRWTRRLLVSWAAILLPTAIAAVFIQTATMAGSFAEALDPDSLKMVLTGMHLGWALSVRMLIVLILLFVAFVAKPSRTLWIACTMLGAVVVASLAWGGHGAAGDGLSGIVHLTSDLLHLFAAAVWIGALIVLAGLLADAKISGDRERLAALHRALEGFSGIGSAVVAVLIATGLINSWFLVGWHGISGLLTTPYGLLLSAKLFLFSVMLILAASNRFRLTPDLWRALGNDGPPDKAIAALKKSVLFETSAAMAVLVLVSILGTLAPISAQ
jgi:putative copper resistance protein D